MKTFFLKSAIDRQISFEGKSYFFFSGTSYLGIGQNTDFQEQLILGMKKWGINHGMSRINNVRLSVYDEFEAYFAQQAQADAALVMSSGYLAGMTALQLLTSKTDQIWVAPDTHPAILPLNLKPDPRESFESWKNNCLEKSHNLPPQRIVFLGNAVNPLIPEIHDYTWLKHIAQKHEVSFLLDDSHAFGVLGNDIFGTYAQWKKLPIRLVVSGSLGKGLGIPGGIILSDQKTGESLKKLPIYGGASPCPPGFLQAFLSSKEAIKQQAQTLKDRVSYFHQNNIIPNEVYGAENYPVFSYANENWVQKLEENNIITSSFHYPTAKDPAVNRIIISAFHREDDIDYLLNTLQSIKQE